MKTKRPFAAPDSSSRRPNSRIPKGTGKKAELFLIRDPDAADVAALFESLTGRKPTEAEMREVRKTLAEPPQGTTKR